ncbi:MAG: lysophospholipase L1-like esterase [Glaciecola sp.]|jgi:lysophospholipase L1-like esterase
MESSKTSGWKRKVSLMLGVTLFLLFVLEIGATLYMGQTFERGRFLGDNWIAVGRRDVDMGWANRAGASGHIAGSGLDYTVNINSLGFRDPERTYAKPAGVKRVLVLGDSVTWGWGVDNGERFSDLLEARLGEEVQVLNMGVPGYGTGQQFWNLEKFGWRYEPDAVVLCLVLNDVLEAEMIEHYGMPKPRFALGEDGEWFEERPPGLATTAQTQGWTREMAWLQAHSAAVTLLTGKKAALGEGLDLDKIEYRDPGDQAREGIDRATRCISSPERATHYGLTRIAAACAERGLPLIVTSMAHKHDRYLYEPNHPMPAQAEGPDYMSSLAREVQAAGQSIGFQTVSPDGVMLGLTKAGQRLHCGDGHPNALGHKVMADVLEPLLRKELQAQAPR